MGKDNGAAEAARIDPPLTRKAIAARDKAIEDAVAGIEFPLERPDGLTRDEIKERAKGIEDAVAGIDFTPPESNVKADRKAVHDRNAAVEAAQAPKGKGK